jgi:hypothetical protein
MKKLIFLRILVLIGMAAFSPIYSQTETNKSQDQLKVIMPELPSPTFADVHYGLHEHQVLDFWKAESNQPTPVMFFIHGGGWMNGDKQKPEWLSRCLKEGISVVSINYRLIPDANQEKVNPPVQWPLQDAARSLQFVRSKAAEWNLDKNRIGAAGGSAGGFSSLYLAFHDDMAEPKSEDPISRESSRVKCALVVVPQTSLDPVQMKQWIPNINYGQHAFALESYQAFFDKRDELMPWIRDYSPYELVTPDDPPVYLYYNSPPTSDGLPEDPTHSANFGVGLIEKLKKENIAFEFNYPGAPNVKHSDMFTFLIEQLKNN